MIEKQQNRNESNFKKSSHYNVAIVGATGVVGQNLLNILIERNFPINHLKLFASERSLGKKIVWSRNSQEKNEVVCETLKLGCFENMDFVFFDASDAISEEWVSHAADAGAWVIDNSSAYRLDSEKLLLVPEVNGYLLKEKFLNWKKNKTYPSTQDRILCGPNCSVVQMTLPLEILNNLYGLKKIIVSTYQSTSGAGSLAQKELEEQTKKFLNQESYQPEIFPHPIAFNCIPQIGKFRSNGYTSEEEKIQLESKKILRTPSLSMVATAVRVPTFSCHAGSVFVECEKEVNLAEFRKALKIFPGVTLLDDPEKSIYPLGITHSSASFLGGAGEDSVNVGRIRIDENDSRNVCFWVVSDNLRKGAALNAIQIGELILSEIE